ncbi:hypothetical protein AB0W27_00145 [Aliarcobacter butzleri]|uniref:hypothetical protein n=1 Tax=Aliarcobacter butzleri TaxID=28197 RepID=UPI00125F5D53|nr:hypothetical protein [Aliarcobacter butzleri]MCG3686981.1 hypothetical protein [Aliarcobacter butzleri]MDN5089601.1 hypothetical protein [Aliarcobacter butzleri]
MNSKQIAMYYIAKQVTDPKDIFLNEKLFKDVIFWARESAKELLNTQNNKRFLLNYIDDIGSIIDEYMNIRRLKMFYKKFKKKNKYSCEEIISFIICRWLNVFYNLTSNSRYRDFIDISKTRELYQETIIYYELHTAKNSIEIERINKLDRKIIQKGLKKVWVDSISDMDFDILDFQDLCYKFGFSLIDILIYNPWILPQMSKQDTNNNNYQLVLVFQDKKIA